MFSLFWQTPIAEKFALVSTETYQTLEDENEKNWAANITNEGNFLFTFLILVSNSDHNLKS